jgi:hypothetical protein
MDEIIHIRFDSDSRSMSIDSGYSECRDRTAMIDALWGGILMLATTYITYQLI